MLTFELLRDKGILVVQPAAPLQTEDSRCLAATVDPYITERGQLTGLIEAPSFPGWDSFGALVEHLRFVRDHYRSIKRVGAVTDSGFLKVTLKTAEHFAHPEIKAFDGAETAVRLAGSREKTCSADPKLAASQRYRSERPRQFLASLSTTQEQESPLRRR